MTKVGVLAFTQKGGLLGRVLVDGFAAMGCEAEGYLSERHHVEGMHSFGELDQIVRTVFADRNILVFVGACGIAVRAIAPYIKQKTQDPGVIVVDECGTYAVSLLSGHIGKANAFAEHAARIVGGEAVITTATDRNGVFAVDEWAVDNSLRILTTSAVKEISSRILAGETVGFYAAVPVEGPLPGGLAQTTEAEAGIVVSKRREMRFPITCCLTPMDLVAGMGCKKGKTFRELDAFLRRVFVKNALMPERLGKLCSISDKAEEEGLKKLAQTMRIPFETYTAKALLQAKDHFAASDFVEKQMGVDNVCERSACVGSGGGRKLVGKQAFDGMTIAIYQRKIKISF